MAKKIFNIADGIITPWNVARSWHWFCQVTAACNMAREWCGCGIVTVNSPSGSTLQCDTWLCDDMPLNSPGGSTLHCGRWLWDWIRPNVRHIGILNLVSISTTSPQSTCHSAPVYPKFYPNRTTLVRKKWRHVDFQDGGSQPSWILGVP